MFKQYWEQKPPCFNFTRGRERAARKKVRVLKDEGWSNSLPGVLSGCICDIYHCSLAVCVHWKREEIPWSLITGGSSVEINIYICLQLSVVWYEGFEDLNTSEVTYYYPTGGLQNQMLPPFLKTLASNNRAAAYSYKEPLVFESFELVQLEFHVLSLKPVQSFTP